MKNVKHPHQVTNESFEMVNILEMMEYDHYNPLWREQMEQVSFTVLKVNNYYSL